MDYKNKNIEVLKLKRASVYDLDINPKNSQNSPLETDDYSKKTDLIDPSINHEQLRLSESLRKAQDQLGLCLQKQRQIGFILKEVKGILKN